MAEHTLRSIAFPVLRVDQIAQLANCATVAPKQYRDGETLIHVVIVRSSVFLSSRARLKFSTILPTRQRRSPFTGKTSHRDISDLTGTPANYHGDCPRRRAEDAHRPPEGPVYGRHFTFDRHACSYHGDCPWRLPSIRGLGRSVAACIESVSRLERYYSPGFYCTPAVAARVARVHRLACDRIALFPGYISRA